MRIDRFTYIRMTKARFIVIDNRLHILFATTENETRARKLVELLNADGDPL